MKLASEVLREVLQQRERKLAGEPASPQYRRYLCNHIEAVAGYPGHSKVSHKILKQIRTDLGETRTYGDWLRRYHSDILPDNYFLAASDEAKQMEEPGRIAWLKALIKYYEEREK